MNFTLPLSTAFLFIVVFLTAWCNQTRAQTNLPLINQYYTNPYLWNPAQAGGYDHTVAFLTYKNQWSAVDGHPVITSFTANAPVFSASGAGINIYNDQSGFLRRTKAMLSFSQTIFIDQERTYISFGLSAGILFQAIDLSKVSGETGKPVDPVAAGFNGNIPFYPDVDLGIAFRMRGLDIDLAIPNLVKYTALSNSQNNIFTGLPLFFSSAGYNFQLDDDWAVHPKLAFRKVIGFSTQMDLSSMLTYKGKISLAAFIHSDKAFSLSLGFMANNSLDLNYAFTHTGGALNQYFGNTHEFSIGYHFYDAALRKSSKNLLIRCPRELH